MASWLDGLVGENLSLLRRSQWPTFSGWSTSSSTTSALAQDWAIHHVRSVLSSYPFWLHLTLIVSHLFTKRLAQQLFHWTWNVAGVNIPGLLYFRWTMPSAPNSCSSSSPTQPSWAPPQTCWLSAWPSPASASSGTLKAARSKLQLLLHFNDSGQEHWAKTDCPADLLCIWLQRHDGRSQLPQVRHQGLLEQDQRRCTSWERLLELRWGFWHHWGWLVANMDCHQEHCHQDHPTPGHRHHEHHDHLEASPDLEEEEIVVL